MKAVVAEISFFDNNMTQTVVEVSTDSWKEAYLTVLKGKLENESCGDDFEAWVADMPENLEEARDELLNGEMDISVVFID